MQNQRKFVLALLAGCLTTTASAETRVIEVSNIDFTPESVNAIPGDTIRWEWIGGNHVLISGTSCTSDGLFESPLNPMNTAFEWVVPNPAPSNVPYFCEPHCAFGMTGDIAIHSGTMFIGLIDAAWIHEVNYTTDTGTPGMNRLQFDSSTGSTYSLGVTSEGGSAMIDVDVFGTVSLYNVTNNSLTTLPSGESNVILDDSIVYLFTGSPNSTLEVVWMEPSSDPPSITELTCGNCSLHVSEDALSVRALTGFISFDGPGEVAMTPIGSGVSSSSLTLPPSGEEGTVFITNLGGEVLLNGVTNPAWLLVNMNSGGSGGPCDADITDDGIVSVNDLLAVIAAWGAICP